MKKRERRKSSKESTINERTTRSDEERRGAEWQEKQIEFEMQMQTIGKRRNLKGGKEERGTNSRVGMSGEVSK